MSTPRARLQAAQPTGTDLVAVTSALAGLARRQAGIVTRAQLRRHGLTDSQVRAAVDARRWRPFGRQVIALHNGALTAEQRTWVATLLPGKTCALAGASAAALGGLRGFEPERVHVVVRHATHVRAPTWVKLHESRRFSAVDVRRAGGVPHTSIVRSIVDAAAWSRWPRRACAILCAGVQQRLVTVDQLAAELRQAGAIRHVAILRDVLGDIGGGGHTLAEIDLGPLARRAGLGRPHRQVLRREPSGKVRYLDVEFVLPDGTVLVVEIDGTGHLDIETWWEDTRRENEIVIAGRPVIRFPSVAIRLADDQVVDQLRRARLAHTPH